MCVSFKYFDVDKGNLTVTCHFLKQFHSHCGVRRVLIESVGCKAADRMDMCAHISS